MKKQIVKTISILCLLAVISASAVSIYAGGGDPNYLSHPHPQFAASGAEPTVNREFRRRRQELPSAINSDSAFSPKIFHKSENNQKKVRFS